MNGGRAAGRRARGVGIGIAIVGCVAAGVGAWRLASEGGIAAPHWTAPETGGSEAGATAPTPTPAPVDRVAFDPQAAARRSLTPAQEAEANAPLPEHLRRVAIVVAYDDGTPFSGMNARPAPADLVEEPEDGPHHWASTEGVSPGVELDASGFAFFRVPRDAAFRLMGDGGTESPPFMTDVVAAGVVEALLRVPANRIDLRLLDEDGAPFVDRSVRATGRGGGGAGAAERRTGADGIAQFRGFAAGVAGIRVALETEAGPGDAEPIVILDGSGGVLQDGRCDVVVPGATTLVVRRLPLLIGTVQDEAGEPVAFPWCEARIRVSGHPDFVALPGVNGLEDGRFRLTVPIDDEALALRATLDEVVVEVRAPHAARPAAFAKSGGLARGHDFGALVVPGPRWLKFQGLDAAGRPLEDVRVAPVDAEGRLVPERRAEVRAPDGAAIVRAVDGDRGYRIGSPGMLDADVDGEGAATTWRGFFSVPGKAVRLRPGACLILRRAGPSPHGVRGFTAALFGPRRFRSWFLSSEDERGFRSDAEWSSEAETLEYAGLADGVPLMLRLYLGEQETFAAAVAPLNPGERREIVVPSPPPRFVVRVTGSAKPEPWQVAMVPRPAAGPVPQGPGRKADGTDENGVTYFGDVAAGRYLVRAEIGGAELAREIDVVDADVTADFEAPPTRLVRLRLRGARPMFLRTHDISAWVDPRRPLIVKGPEDAEVVAIADPAVWTTEAVVGATVTFAVSLAGRTVVAAAPPGTDEAEIEAPPAGALIVRLAAPPIVPMLATVVLIDEHGRESARESRSITPAGDLVDRFVVAPGAWRVSVTTIGKDAAESTHRSASAGPAVVDADGTTTLVVHP